MGVFRSRGCYRSPISARRCDLVAARGCARRGHLGELVCLLVALGPAMCQNPTDGRLIIPGADAVADLHRRDGEALVRAEGVRAEPVDGRRVG